MTSPGNQHCVNCIGTLSFPISHWDAGPRRGWLVPAAIDPPGTLLFAANSTTSTCRVAAALKAAFTSHYSLPFSSI